MEENKKSFEQNPAVGTAEKMKKLKTAGIILGALAVFILILFSTLAVLGLGRVKMGSTMMTGDGFSAPMSADWGVSKSSRMVENMGVDLESAGSSETTSVGGGAVQKEISTDKKIIKNGNLTVRVDKLSVVQGEISEIAKGNGGSVFSSNIYQSSNNLKNGNIIIKVPVKNFEKAFDEIKNAVALVLRESTSGMDVTEEYQDLEIQIKNKQAEEQSYVKILDQSGKISDVLEVTQQIARVRGEIERLQGRIRFMNSQTDMSTISINLSEDQNVTIVDSWRPLQVAKDAVNSLVKSIQNFVDFIIVLIITFIPVAILYLLVIFIIFLIVRKIYRKIRKKNEVSK